MSEALMQEVRYDKVRVSLVVPRSVETRFVDPVDLTQAGGSCRLTMW